MESKNHLPSNVSRLPTFPPTVTTTTSILCGIVMLVLSISGLVVYCFFILIVFKRKKFNQRPFFIIAGWLGVADCLTLLNIICYSAPCVILNRPISDAAIFGGALNVAWFTSLPLILLLAVNRYLCICSTDLCKKVYTKEKSFIYCLISWCFGIAYSVPSFTQCCPIYFDHVLMTWRWDVVRRGSAILSAGELIMVVLVTLSCFTLNGIVIRAIKNARLSTATLSKTQESQRLARERKVFFQFFITNIWLVIFDIPFITMGHLEEPSRWLGYFVTITYIVNCSINGWVYLTLNKTIQKEIRVWIEDLAFWCACCYSDRESVPQRAPESECASSSQVTLTYGNGRGGKACPRKI